MMNNLLSIKLMRILFHEKFVYIFVLVLIVLSIFNFNAFLSSGSELKNIYDLLLFTFNDFFYLFYNVSPMFLILVYPFSPFSTFHQYLLVKFKNRAQWLSISIVTMGIIGFLYILGLVLLCFLQSILTLGFENQWSEYGLSKYQSLITNDKPLAIVLSNLVLVYLYLFSLGLIFLIANLFTRNSIVSFILTIGINIFSVIIFISRLSFFYPVTFSYHVLISHEEFIKTDFYEHLFISIFYWLSLIVILLVAGFIKLRKIDFNRRGK